MYQRLPGSCSVEGPQERDRDIFRSSAEPSLSGESETTGSGCLCCPLARDICTRFLATSTLAHERCPLGCCFGGFPDARGVQHLEAEMGMIKHRHNHLRAESRALLQLLLSEGGRRLEEKALAVLGQLVRERSQKNSVLGEASKIGRSSPAKG